MSSQNSNETNMVHETLRLELEETSSEGSVDISDYWDNVFSPPPPSPPSSPPPLSPPPSPPPVHTLPIIKNYQDFREIACGPTLNTFMKFTEKQIKDYVPMHCDRAVENFVCRSVSDKIKDNIINEILETINKA